MKGISKYIILEVHFLFLQGRGHPEIFFLGHWLLYIYLFYPISRQTENNDRARTPENNKDYINDDKKVLSSANNLKVVHSFICGVLADWIHSFRELTSELSSIYYAKLR